MSYREFPVLMYTCVCTYCMMTCCSPVCGECRVCMVLQAGGRGCTESVHTQPWHVSPCVGLYGGIMTKLLGLFSLTK